MALTMLFQRFPKDPVAYPTVRAQLSKVFRANNLEAWNQRRIYHSFTAENADAFICYAFEVLADWRRDNEAYTADYLRGIDFILKMLNLQKYLHTDEVNYLNQYREIVFAQRRNLKDLIVDFPRQPGEMVWYRYAVSCVHQNGTPLLTNGELYISNQRVIFVSGNLYTTLPISEIRSWKIRANCLQLMVGEDCFRLFSDQILTIYVSFERIMRLLKLFISTINI